VAEARRRAIGRTEWLDEGLAVLSRQGDQGLTLDRLCRQLHRTKGSFYHHFEDIAAYHQALLEHWRAGHTRALIEATRPLPTAAARHAALDQLAISLDPRVELAMRAWSQTDARAARLVAAVDKERIGYLTELHNQAGFSPSVAEELAIIEYTTFIGWLSTFPDTPAALRARVLGRWTALLKTASRR
jgi:AcrR family transcriptional regulator